MTPGGTTTVSDAQGNFVFENIPAGEYSLQFETPEVVGGFGVELREDRVVDHLTLRIGHEDHRIDVAHLRTDTYGDIRSLEFGISNCSEYSPAGIFSKTKLPCASETVVVPPGVIVIFTSPSAIAK